MRTTIRWLCGAAAACATGVAIAAGTTDYTDQWWTPSEPGWGVAVLQQRNTLFVDLLVYDTDGKPTWYTGTAGLQSSSRGEDAFAGDLWTTSGPSLAGRFDPMQVAARKVGTLQFETNGPNAASLTYAVDGVAVTKAVARQTWSGDNLTGHYVGAWNVAFADDWIVVDVKHSADNQITLYLESAPPPSMGYLLMSGTYTAKGRMGEATVALQAGDRGMLYFSEIDASSAGFIARVTGDLNGSPIDGRMAVARSR